MSLLVMKRLDWDFHGKFLKWKMCLLGWKWKGWFCLSLLHSPCKSHYKLISKTKVFILKSFGDFHCEGTENLMDIPLYKLKEKKLLSRSSERIKRFSFSFFSVFSIKEFQKEATLQFSKKKSLRHLCGWTITLKRAIDLVPFAHCILFEDVFFALFNRLNMGTFNLMEAKCRVVVIMEMHAENIKEGDVKELRETVCRRHFIEGLKTVCILILLSFIAYSNNRVWSFNLIMTMFTLVAQHA